MSTAGTAGWRRRERRRGLPDAEIGGVETGARGGNVGSDGRRIERDRFGIRRSAISRASSTRASTRVSRRGCSTICSGSVATSRSLARSTPMRTPFRASPSDPRGKLKLPRARAWGDNADAESNASKSSQSGGCSPVSARAGSTPHDLCARALLFSVVSGDSLLALRQSLNIREAHCTKNNHEAVTRGVTDDRLVKRMVGLVFAPIADALKGSAGSSFAEQRAREDSLWHQSGDGNRARLVDRTYQRYTLDVAIRGRLGGPRSHGQARRSARRATEADGRGRSPSLSHRATDDDRGA